MSNPIAFGDSPGRKTPQKLASTGEIIKLVVMGVAALAILGVIGSSMLNRPVTTKEPEPEALNAAASDAAGSIQWRNPDGTVSKVEPEDGDRITDKMAPFAEDPDAFLEVEDFTDEWEFDAYYHAIHKTAALTEVQIAAATRPPVVYFDLWKDPKAYRGKFMKVHGSLLYLKREVLPENPSGMRNAFLGGLVANNRKVYTFLVFQIPDGARQRDVIELDGLFYKFWKYENRSGAMVDTPYFIARTFRKIPPHPPQKPISVLGFDLKLGSHVVTWWELAIVLLFAVIVPLFFFLARHERKKYEEFKTEMTDRKKKKAIARAEGAEAPPPAGTPCAGPSSPECAPAPAGGQTQEQAVPPGPAAPGPAGQACADEPARQGPCSGQPGQGPSGPLPPAAAGGIPGEAPETGTEPGNP